MAPVEEVRVCRFCGHIDPEGSTGKCPGCGLFFGFAIVPRTQAEKIARRCQFRFMRRRLGRLLLVLALLGGATVWAVGVFFDRGLNPPRTTTNVSATSGPQTWGQVRRTAQNTGFTPDAAPFPHRVIWTYHTAKPLLASPAVVDDHVYLTTADHRALALHRRTGQTVWEYRTSGPSSSTPAVADQSVIFAIRPGPVVALNRHTAERLWVTDLRHPILASPVVVHGAVYIGAADRKLYALDAGTGRQLWEFATQNWIVAPVAYADARIIVASQGSRIHAVGADTGRTRFIYETGLGRHIGAGAAIQGNRAYFGSIGGRVWAIDWQATTYPLERALLFWQTNLYIWGVLSKPPVQKGGLWAKRVGGDVTHTPAIAHDTVYAATSEKTVVALDTATGAIRWRTDLGVEISAAPTVAGTSVLIGTQAGSVFGLDAQTGDVLWNFKTAGKITGSPIVVGETMYIVSHDGTLYAVSPSAPSSPSPPKG